MIESRVAPGGSGRSDEGARGRLTRVALCAVFFFVVLALPAIAPAADVAPHLTTEEGPDACAMCHRAHTAPGVVARSQFGSWETTSSALILAQPSNAGDAALCLTCHGIDALGSGIEVQSDFAGASAHSLLPDDSRYEEVPEKQCSSCHDAHGAEKRGDGTPYPGLLRAFTEEGEAFYAAEEYCATCHYDSRDAEDNRFDGLEIYEQTAHFGLPGPVSGTEVTCSNCHASHGSDIAPLILGEILPPAAPETATVDPGSPRTLCYACHAEERATWLGAVVYDDDTTPTVHGASSIVLSVTAEYASQDTTRLAGECQSCHNPMGSDDGEGKPIAKLAGLEGRELCYSCHNVDNAPDITDMASFAVRPEAIADEPELVVAWDPVILPAAYGGLHVHTRTFGDNAAPYGLEGPRRYRVANGTGGRTGAVAYGDIDGLGDTELVVADPGTPVLRVFRSDPLAGLSYVSHSIEETAAFIEIGEFIEDSTGLPEVAAVSVEVGGTSYLRLYRYNGSGFTRVAGPTAVGDYASGLASGYLTGGPVADLVVTALTANPPGPGELRILNAAGGTLNLVGGPHETRSGPRGPSIGNVWLASSESTEVVVANSGETVDTLSVFDAGGVELASYEATISPDGAVAWDTAIGDILPGTGTIEVAVALRSETTTSGVSVFRTVAGNGLVAHGVFQTGQGYATSSLEIGDIDGDGRIQLLAGNAGVLSHTPGESVAPSVQIFRANEAGDSMSIAATRWAGGAELAGGTPAVAVVDLGPVGRSRHPASAVKGAHVSTETAGFERHAECVDCHNVHALTQEPRVTASAPAAYGVITGAWGLDLEAVETTLAAPAEYEYQVCFKCHAGPTWGGSPRDIAAEFDSTSSHAVTSVDADVYCVDCHGNAGPGPSGPHVSPASPLLSSPFIGVRPAKAEMLCYECHAKSLYYDGTDPVEETGFRHGDTNLHVVHVSASEGHGLGCESCHVSHGGENTFLIRDGLGWLDTATGGQCSTECHLEGAYAYSQSG